MFFFNKLMDILINRKTILLQYFFKFSEKLFNCSKYYFYNGKRFRLSAGLSFEYKNIYFNNKQINYFGFKRSPQQASSLYETLIEKLLRKNIMILLFSTIII